MLKDTWSPGNVFRTCSTPSSRLTAVSLGTACSSTLRLKLTTTPSLDLLHWNRIRERDTNRLWLFREVYLNVWYA
ncbi:hypothetical protein BSP15_161 [Bacillus phage BSP15]|nr:hypothetical protein BSP15_161 [Bacillus phage BSP15]